jgi:hypothetical protein
MSYLPIKTIYSSVPWHGVSTITAVYDYDYFFWGASAFRLPGP